MPAILQWQDATRIALDDFSSLQDNARTVAAVDIPVAKDINEKLRNIDWNTTKSWIVSEFLVVRDHVVIAIHSFITVLHQHPYIALAISTLISFPGAIFIPAILFCAVCTPILAILGFCTGGVASGSMAAAFQSASYGAMVPRGSLFASMQALGATTKGTVMIVFTNWLFLIVWLVSCAVWAYVVFGVLL